MVLLVVQPEDHGRVLGQMEEKLLVVAHAHAAEELDLGRHSVAAAHLGCCRRENVVPEESHLLLERSTPIPHGVEPVHLDVEVGPGLLGLRKVTVELELVELGLVLRVEELLHYALVPALGELFELRPCRAESGPTHQVGHLGDPVTISHSRAPNGRRRRHLQAYRTLAPLV